LDYHEQSTHRIGQVEAALDELRHRPISAKWRSNFREANLLSSTAAHAILRRLEEAFNAYAIIAIGYNPLELTPAASHLR
jgi:hypothetical protein